MLGGSQESLHRNLTPLPVHVQDENVGPSSLQWSLTYFWVLDFLVGDVDTLK